ncbi:MAG: hypothetical protein C0418_02015 [Coriobacteriaceae bacterium]|nr:hypothetical protein [Coriobacteriaceae bacterium]
MRAWLVIGVAVLFLMVLAGAGGAAAWFLLGPGGSRTGTASVSGSDPASLGFDTVPGEQMGSASGAGSTGAPAQDATTSAEESATP